MTRLYSYTIPYDDGAAPNPFRGMCTLAICKPDIRLSAREGDWLVGLGSLNAPSGNLGGKLVYAMRVEQIITLADYDRLAPTLWPSRIPNLSSPVIADRLGDCIYDFSVSPPRQRPGVHGPGNRANDLRGKNVLISHHYFYFGRNAIPLPTPLLGIVHQRRKHKVHLNRHLVQPFVDWIHSLGLDPGHLYGWPDGTPNWARVAKTGCRRRC